MAHVVAGVLALAAVAGAQQSTVDYRLGAGDRVRVLVYGHADLSGDFVVDGAGRLSLPLIQLVPAQGLTVQQLEAAITAKLRPDYLINPRVSVEVLNYRPFYIVGEIKNPGSYPYVNGLTVIEAVALAGGYTYRAKKDAVTITRARVVDDTGDEHATPHTVVLPGDVIEVPERFF